MNLDMHILRGVIDDGGPEMRVNETFEWFSLGFWTESALIPSKDERRYFAILPDTYYKINAEVIYISQASKQSACIIDFGIQAISEVGSIMACLLPSDCKEGDYVTGEIRLHLPLCTIPSTFDLSNIWHIDRVTADLSDFRFRPGDLRAAHYQNVSGTDIVKAGSYVLGCSLLDP